MSSDASPARSPDEQLADEVDDDLGGLFGDEEDPGLDGEEDNLGLNGNEEDAGLEGDEAMDVINTMPAEMGVHPAPDPTDGELYLFKVPQFLAFEPTCFDPSTFQPPTTDLHSKEGPSADFSAYKTAMRSIRWRKAPDGSGNLQSNARILRWSDGSLTLQMANDPGTQYLLPANPLTPPQHNPPKPTPTSTGGTKRRGMQKQQPYNVEKDAFTFLATPSESSSLLRVTNKFTTSLQVEPSRDASEDAVKRLRERIEQARQESSSMKGENGLLEMVNISESPELAKARAELAEKERAKALRKRENQEFKNEERASGRTTARRSLGVSLNANSLEMDEEFGASTKRRQTSAGKPRQKRAARRGEILSDDEDEAWGNRGRTREDEYDEEDDFLAPSDEEEEVGAGEEDEDDIDEGIVLETTRSRKRASPTEEQDAEGEPDEDDQGGRQNTKRRRVIDDEEEDDE